MGKSLANHEMLIPGHLKRWQQPEHVAKFLREVGYTDVTGIWPDTDTDRKTLSSPDPDGLKIAVQRGERDMVSGVERAKRIKSRIQFAIKFAGLSRDIRAVRIGRTDAPSRELLIEKSKDAGLPDQWIYSGENPWFQFAPDSRTKKTVRGIKDDTPNFMRNYVSLVSHIDQAQDSPMSKIRLIDDIDEEHKIVNASLSSDYADEEWYKAWSTLEILKWGLILAAAKGFTHSLMDVKKVPYLTSKLGLEWASSFSKWLPFYGRYGMVRDEMTFSCSDETANILLTVTESRNITHAIDYLLGINGSDSTFNRLTISQSIQFGGKAYRELKAKISSAFQMKNLDDSMLAKHPRKQPKKS